MQTVIPGLRWALVAWSLVGVASIPHLATAAPVAAEGGEHRALPSMTRLLLLAEQSELLYEIKSLEDLELGEDYSLADRWWPRRPGSKKPAVDTLKDGRRALLEFDCTEETWDGMEVAETHFDVRDYGLARDAYFELAKRDPGCYLIWSHIGDSYLFSRRPSEAIRFYEKAIELNPWDYRGYFYRANAQFKLGRTEESVASFRQALSLRSRPDSVTEFLRKAGPELGVDLLELPFEPQAWVERSDSTVEVAFELGRPEWLSFALCKAVWLAEPAYREERTGKPERVESSTTEDLECLSQLIVSYQDGLEDGDREPDPMLDRLTQIANEGYLLEFWLYEIASRSVPDILILLGAPDAVETSDVARISEYVDRFVLVARDSKPLAKPPVGSLTETENALVRGRGEGKDRWWQALPRPAWAPFEPTPTPGEWFEVYEVQPRVFAIYEPGQFEEVISYLIVGEARALLFDTGLGIGDIAAVVSELTALPITVLNSHTHYDHVGGNYQFETIYGTDTPYTLRHTAGRAPEEVAEFVSEGWIWKDLPEGFHRTRYRSHPFSIQHTVQDGEVLDLGGISLEVLLTPGHAPDSLCLLDRANRRLFTGDTFYPASLYSHQPGSDFAAYRETAERLATLVDDVDFLLPAHNEPLLPSRFLTAFAAAFHRVQLPKTPFVLTDGHREYDFVGFSLLVSDPPPWEQGSEPGKGQEAD